MVIVFYFDFLHHASYIFHIYFINQNFHRQHLPDVVRWRQIISSVSKSKTDCGSCQDFAQPKSVLRYARIERRLNWPSLYIFTFTLWRPSTQNWITGTCILRRYRFFLVSRCEFFTAAFQQLVVYSRRWMRRKWYIIASVKYFWTAPAFWPEFR